MKKFLATLALSAALIVPATADSWITPSIDSAWTPGGPNCMQHARRALDAAGFPAKIPSRNNTVYGQHGEYNVEIVCIGGQAIFFIGGNNEPDAVVETLTSIEEQWNNLK